MQIIQIISGDLWAGAEVMYYRLQKGLYNFQDINLTSILLNEGKLAEEIRNLGIPVIVVDETRLNFFQILRNIENIVRQISPDIIHSHRMKENILAYMSVRNYDKKIHLISTQHGMLEPLREKLKWMKETILTKYNYYILSKYFKYVIAVSEDVKNNLIKYYDVPASKVLTINNGTDVLKHNINGKKKSVFKIGSAGRFFPVKDYILMVEIAHEVLKINDNVLFELAGEGPEKNKIFDLVRKYKLEKVFINKGFLNDMNNFYQGLDIYINTSLHEGNPISVLEAMAHGLPVIAPNTGGLKEILVDELQGLLVEGRNPKSFAEKCLQLYSDDDLRLKMGFASRNRVIKVFSTENMINNYHNLYRKILNINILT